MQQTARCIELLHLVQHLHVKSIAEAACGYEADA